MTPQTKRKFRLVLIGLVGLYLIFVFIKMFKSERLEFSTTYVPKYTTMFFSQKANLVVSSGTHLSEKRNPISNYEIDKKYDLVVYQIDLANGQPITKLVSQKNEESSMTSNEVYSNINESLFEISLKDDKPSIAEKIIMKYQGENFIETIKNDTIAYYNLDFTRLSFQYRDAEKADLFLKTKGAGLTENSRPLSILFFRRQKALYLFLLSPKLAETTLDKNLLYNLVQSD
jgi:predicted MPP superfamily phosphohydrolase